MQNEQKLVQITGTTTNSTKKEIINKNKNSINKRRIRQTCNKCGKKGHVSKECKEKTKKRF